MAWAFQRNSELLPIFKYYLDQMQQNGVIKRLRTEFIGDQNGASNAFMIQEHDGLGYDSVVIPFLALLIGSCVAMFILAIEAMVMCKKQYSHGKYQSKDDNSKLGEANDMIEDIYDLLLDNHRQLGGIGFLLKIRTLVSGDA